MIKRIVFQHFVNWKEKPNRKPMILRGARQVGKTTFVREFGKQYNHFLYFNLELVKHKEVFAAASDIDTLVQLLFAFHGKRYNPELSTLIFIDEIQEEPHIIEQLRYFYEEYPHLHVVVAGSLLDFALEKVERTPVGRVEYMLMHPICFSEYLEADQQEGLIELLKQVPLPNELLKPFFTKFHEYAMIGGMPEVVKHYVATKDVTNLASIYSSLYNSYKADVIKYASNHTQNRVLDYIVAALPYEVDKRITFENFAQSGFKGREVREALKALEKARLIQLLYPTTRTQVPAIPSASKSPRLQFLDVGLVNHELKLHKELLTNTDLHNTTRGSLIQQLVWQEIFAQQYLPQQPLPFWVRQEKGSDAEVDIVYPYKQYLIPIEVKSGATGTLRSLHEYMDRCEHTFAIRFYKGNIKVDDTKTSKGKQFKLLNLPYFLAAYLEQYLDWWIGEHEKKTPRN